MQDTALPWLVLERTHSSVQVGLLLFCRYVPFSVFGLWAGVLADRFDNRLMLMLTQAASMCVAAALAAETFLHGSLGFVYALAVLGGAAVVFDSPNRQTLMFRLVGREELPNAVALNSSLFSAGRVVGPAVGGVVIAAAGVGWCFAVNAISFLAVLLALALMRVTELYSLDRGEGRPRGLAAIREGLSFVRHRRGLRLVIVGVGVVAIVGFNVRVLIPVMTVKTLHSGPHTLGVLFGCFGIGALAGALYAASAERPRWRRSLISLGAFGIALLALGIFQSVWSAGALLVVGGAAFSIWTATSQAMLQVGSPDALRGRVVSLYLMVFGGLSPIGSLLSGWLADLGGTRLAFLIAGGAVSATAVYSAVDIRAEHGHEPAGRATRFLEPPT
jgi:MFS family permease